MGKSQKMPRSRQLRPSGLLKVDWDPTKHPRWPAGSPGGIGGEFAQIAIPAPFELPGWIPLPSEIVPPPVIPDIYARRELRNPYPNRPECEEQ